MIVPKPPLDAPAFLAWEAGQTEKYEHLNGEAFAMACASKAHVTLALNKALALRSHLRGGPCSASISDMEWQVETDNAVFYPDVFVTFAESDHAYSRYKAALSLVVEALPPTTSAYVRTGKFATYRKLPSLREYALADTKRLILDLFQPDESGHWGLYPDEAGDTVEFISVGLSVPVEQLYEDVNTTLRNAQP